VDSLNLTGVAVIQGVTEVADRLILADLTAQIIENYQKQGSVNFNYSLLTNANTRSGSKKMGCIVLKKESGAEPPTLLQKIGSNSDILWK
jgi:hypothetical protein